MRRSVSKRVVSALGLAFLACIAIQAEALAEGDERTLGNVDIVKTGGCTAIRIGLARPALYLRHFPRAAGSEVLIFLHFPGSDPRDPSSGLQRETASVPPEAFPPLLDVTFEGDAPGGPYVSLRFSQEQTFAVRQGEDFRGITVFVPQPGWSKPCPPDP